MTSPHPGDANLPAMMSLVCLDVEGVLLPEIWIATAEATGITELRRTTRDEPDYDKLMRYRLEILDQHKLSLPRIHEVIATIDPLPGAVAFLQRLQAQTRVILLSDTFEEFATPLMAKLGHPTLFCHNLDVSPDGQIHDYVLRLPDHKRHAVEHFRALNFHVRAAGDSYNDLAMLTAAQRGVWFRPPANVTEEHPEFSTATTYEDLERALLTP